MMLMASSMVSLHSLGHSDHKQHVSENVIVMYIQIYYAPQMPHKGHMWQMVPIHIDNYVSVYTLYELIITSNMTTSTGRGTFHIIFIFP